MVAIGEPDMYSAGNPVQATTTTLKELQVFPQPVQKPHPQLWEPVTSSRSIKWAAQKGMNGVMIVEPNDRLRKNIDIYYEAAEKAGWPDMHGRGRFKYGWDAAKRRGIMTSRYIHITTPGKEKQALERAARAMELQFDYYGPFGFGAVVARLNEPMFDLNRRVTAEMLREREIAIQGSKQFVIDKIMKMKTECGYDDFSFLAWFELGGFEGREIEDQMQLFAEEVMPVIARECGGKVELPERRHRLCRRADAARRRGRVRGARDAQPQTEDLKTLYKGWVAALAANPAMELDQMRRMFDHWGDVTAEPGGVDYVEVTAGGVPALWATPKGCAQDRVLLCTHGGGYVTGSMYTHRKVYGHVAKAIGCRALIVHYRRAPEHVHPGPVDDVVDSYRWLLDRASSRSTSR